MSATFYQFILTRLALVLALIGGSCQVARFDYTFVGPELRSYAVHIPDTLDLSQPQPLLVVLHQFGDNGPRMASLTGFSAIADREGFVVVYPNGRNVSWNSDLDGVTSGVKFVDDSEFVLALVDELIAKYGLDETRIYVTGASNGGMMTQRLACQHPEVFAAAAPVMGSLEEANAMDCAPAVPIPILLLHGTADETVPYEGGTRDTLRAPTYLSVPENAQLWAGFNGCDPLSPRSFLLPDVVPGDGTRARYTAFRDCPDSATTAYYTLEGGGHTWPGSSQNYPETVVGPVSFEIDASEVIWDFVSQFQRTPGAG